jgi:hypothetical protein
MLKELTEFDVILQLDNNDYLFDPAASLKEL